MGDKIGFFQHVEARLENWAKWWVRANDGGLGWSPNQTDTLLHRLMKQASGGYAHRDSYAEMSEEARDAVEVESLLLEMEKIEEMRRNAAVVRVRFAGTGTIEEKAIELGISRQRFHERLMQGSIWIASAMRHDFKNRT
ncbi:MAG: hypothetical protein HQL97_01210 [Magnetococcales bacterium]|nr:hypothetical protein [Magnetococcales bacterium]